MIAYLKVSAVGVAAGVADERQRLQWAAGKLPVPSVIDAGDDEGMAWMLLGPLPGTDGTDPLLLARPEQLVRMLAKALRQLHDLPPTACPFDFRLPTAMTHVETRLRCGQIDTTEFKVEYAHHTPETAVLALRRDLPAAEDLVVTHGDYCVPNIVFDADHLSGFVDVGELGVADRWRDLAVATWSIERNIGYGWENFFLSVYGAEPDPARMRFFRLLYELAS
jgi:aminoglycoside 3'-phosphotransferase-2